MNNVEKLAELRRKSKEIDDKVRKLLDEQNLETLTGAEEKIGMCFKIIDPATGREGSLYMRISSIDTLEERKKVFLRREKHGRTGVFLKKQLQIDETTEEALKNLANKKSIVRKKLFKI